MKNCKLALNKILIKKINNFIIPSTKYSFFFVKFFNLNKYF